MYRQSHYQQLQFLSLHLKFDQVREIKLEISKKTEQTKRGAESESMQGYSRISHWVALLFHRLYIVLHMLHVHVYKLLYMYMYVNVWSILERSSTDLNDSISSSYKLNMYMHMYIYMYKLLKFCDQNVSTAYDIIIYSQQISQESIHHYFLWAFVVIPERLDLPVWSVHPAQ